MPSNKVKTTKAQFEAFKQECLRLQPILGLQAYEVKFEWTELEGNTRAQIAINISARAATIRFAKRVYKECGPHPIKDARHEMTHLFTERLEWLGRSRHVLSGEFDEEVEKLAQILSKFKLELDTQ